MSGGGDPEDLLIFPNRERGSFEKDPQSSSSSAQQSEEEALTNNHHNQDDLLVDASDIAALEELKKGISGFFFQLEPESMEPKRHEVILFYDPSSLSDDLGTLYYCLPNQQQELVRNVECSLPLHQLREMFLQKQTPIFRHSSANDISEDCCLTLVADDRTWSLAAKTTTDRVVWMKAIEYCLKVAGRGIEMSEDEQSDNENNVMNQKELLQQQNFPPEVIAVMEGSYIWRYKKNEATKEVKKMHQFLNYRPYEPTRADMGGDFCMGNGMQIDERLRLSDVTDLYLQKQTPELAEAKEARDDCCFSILGLTSTVNIEMPDPSDVVKWTAGITFLLSQLGKNVVRDTDSSRQTSFADESGVGGRTNLDDNTLNNNNINNTLNSNTNASFLSSSSATAPLSPSKQRYSVLGNTTPRAAVLSSLTPIQMIEKGNLGKLFSVNKQTEDVYLWYSKQRSDLGYVYWAPPQSRNSLNPDSCLDVGDLVEIYVGRQRPAFVANPDPLSQDTNCISLATAQREISFELTESVYDSWIPALSGLLSESGKVVVEEGDDELSPAHSPMNNNNSTSGINNSNSNLRTPYTPMPLRNGRHIRSPSRKRFSFLAREQNPAVPPDSLFSKNKPQDTMEWLAVKRDTITSMSATPILQMMERGAIFTGYAENRKGKFVKKLLLLFYNPSHGRHGTLYWCPPGQRNESRNCSIFLKDITDIFLGKRTDVFESVGAKDAVAEHCFTIMTATKAIDLEAKTYENLNLWLFGINSILTGQAKKTLKQGDPEYDDSLGVGRVTNPSRERFYHLARQHTKKRTNSVSVVMEPLETVPIQHQLGRVLALPLPSVLKMLAGGIVCVTYAKGTDPLHVLVRCDEKELFWSVPDHPPSSSSASSSSIASPSKTSFPSSPSTITGTNNNNTSSSTHSSILLDDISRIWVGKHADDFSQPDQEDEPIKECCVSITTNQNQTLHLETSSIEQLIAFLHGLDRALRQHKYQFSLTFDGQYAVEEEIKEVSEVRPNVFLTVPLDSTIQMMTKGREFLMYTEGGVKTTIFLFFLETDGKAGTLCWCAPGSRIEDNPSKQLPLHLVTDIFLGKQTPVFEHEIAKNVSNERCFSILTSSSSSSNNNNTFHHNTQTSLHLEAESVVQIVAWLCAFDTMLTQTQKKFVLASEDGWPRFSVVTNTSAAVPRAQVHKPQTNAAAVKEMSEGCVFTSYENASNPIKRQLFFFYQPAMGQYGSIYWCEEQQKGFESPYSCIPLHTISYLYTGRQTKIFETEFTKQANESCCFSILGSDDVMNVETPTPSIVNTWIAGIKYILECADRKVECKSEMKTYTQGFIARRYQVISNYKGKNALDDRVLHWLQRGAGLINFSNNNTENGPVTVKLVHVFYSEDDSSLYWPEQGSMSKSPAWRMSLSRITNILVGKQAAIFHCQLATDIPEDCCFSLIGQKEAMHVQTNTPMELKEWISGIIHMLTLKDKRVILDEDRSMPLSSSTATNSGVSRQRLSVTPRGHQGRLAAPKGSPFITMLVAGRVLTRYSLVNGEAQQALSMVFYAEDETPFGSLYWCLPTERRERPDCRMPIHTLGEILLGTGDHIFASEICRSARSVPEQCFSLISESTMDGEGDGSGRSGGGGFALHLKGESQQQRDAWVEGIKTVLTHCGRQVVELDEGKWEEQTTTTSTTTSSSSRSRRWIVHIPHVDEMIVEGLASGDQFTCYEDSDAASSVNAGRGVSGGAGGMNAPVQRKIKLWYAPYESKAGCLCWSYSEQAIAEHTMDLNQILDVYIGKQRRVLQMEFAHQAKEELCFSIVSRDAGLDLCAKDLPTFYKWINGLNHIFTASGRRVEMGEESSSSNRRRFLLAPYCHPASLTGGPVPTQQQITDGASVQDALMLMQRGRIFAALDSGASGTQLFERVRLWYSLSKKALFWSENEERSETHGPLHLADLAYVRLGKQSPALLSDVAADFNDRYCFSLDAATGLRWSFVAQDSAQLSEWLLCLGSILDKEGTRMDLAEDDGGVFLTYAILDEVTVKQTRAELEADPLVQKMQRGCDFKAWEGESHKNWTIFYVIDKTSAGSLCWAEQGTPCVPSPDRSLALDCITDIFLQKQCEANLKANPDCCISILGKAIALHLEAPTQDQAVEWTDGISLILAKTGNRVTDDQEIQDEIPPRQECYELMTHQQSFTLYDTHDDEMVTQFVSLFREGDTIRWMSSSGAGSFALAEITQVLRGKQTARLSSAAPDVAESECLTVVTQKTQLDLQAPSEYWQNVWLDGIQYALDERQHQVVIQDGR